MKRILFIVLLAGCSSKEQPAPPSVELKKEEPAAGIIHVFTPPGDPAKSPTVTALALPTVPGGAAVWGATGRDPAGIIYAGVSIDGIPNPSAHLLAIDPQQRVTDLGGAIENLTRLGVAKPGEGQNKIHTKIVPAVDGKLYFASMDEAGESEDGSRTPTFGSHFWRLTPGQKEWERVGECREAIIACAAGGRFVYYLGYFGHVLYQFDTAADRITGSVGVGAIGGHTSRNFIADDRGHVFVPRVGPDRAELVEFDEILKEVASHPLHGYSRTPDASSHGLVSVAPLKNGGWLFVTDRGRLHRLENGKLTDLGWLHPEGECYAPCLFCPDGETQVAAIGTLNIREPVYQWIRYDLKTQQATAKPLTLTVPPGAKSVLVYGSTTRDNAGRCYVGGRCVLNDRGTPALWMVEP